MSINISQLFAQCPKELLHALGYYAEALEEHGAKHPVTIAALARVKTMDHAGHLARHVTEAVEHRVMTARAMAKHREAASPEFLAAMETYLRLVERLGHDHEESKTQFMLVDHLAPESLRREIRDKASELGLIPDRPDGYTDSGEPVYSLESAAKRLGISLEEAKAEFEKMLAASAAIGIPSPLVDPATIHPVQ